MTTIFIIIELNGYISNFALLVTVSWLFVEFVDSLLVSRGNNAGHGLSTLLESNITWHSAEPTTELHSRVAAKPAFDSQEHTNKICINQYNTNIYIYIFFKKYI